MTLAGQLPGDGNFMLLITSTMQSTAPALAAFVGRGDAGGECGCRRFVRRRSL